MKPTELAITLATLPGRYSADDAWVPADEVRGRLRLLGFDCSAQQVAAWLTRMANTGSPWVERRRDSWDSQWEYRVTRFGKTDIDNWFPGVTPNTPHLPVFRGFKP